MYLREMAAVFHQMIEKHLTTNSLKMFWIVIQSQPVRYDFFQISPPNRTARWEIALCTLLFAPLLNMQTILSASTVYCAIIIPCHMDALSKACLISDDCKARSLFITNLRYNKPQQIFNKWVILSPCCACSCKVVQKPPLSRAWCNCDEIQKLAWALCIRILPWDTQTSSE